MVLVCSPWMKIYLPDVMSDNSKSFFSGAIAGGLAQFVGAPTDRMKSLFQSPASVLPHYNRESMWQLSQSIYKYEGISGIGKGFLLRTARQSGVSGLTMMIYPKLINVLKESHF
jgi:hypothetical protein